MQLCICPRITLIIHGPVLRPIPVTINSFLNNTGHCRRLYIRFTLLCETPQNTLLLHGRIIRPIPVTTQGFIFVSHYYWGAGRTKEDAPESTLRGGPLPYVVLEKSPFLFLLNHSTVLSLIRSARS